MTKQILALDADMVIFDYCSGFIEHCLKRGYQLNYQTAYGVYDLSKWFTNMSHEQLSSEVADYNRNHHPRPFQYLQGVIPKLLDKYVVAIVSSYSESNVARMRRTGALMSLGFSNIYLLDMGESKLSTLQEIGANLYVEDHPKMLQEAVGGGIKTFAIRYPYNEGIAGVNYIKTLEALL